MRLLGERSRSVPAGATVERPGSIETAIRIRRAGLRCHHQSFARSPLGWGIKYTVSLGAAITDNAATPNRATPTSQIIAEQIAAISWAGLPATCAGGGAGIPSTVLEGEGAREAPSRTTPVTFGRVARTFQGVWR